MSGFSHRGHIRFFEFRRQQQRLDPAFMPPRHLRPLVCGRGFYHRYLCITQEDQDRALWWGGRKKVQITTMRSICHTPRLHIHIVIEKRKKKFRAF